MFHFQHAAAMQFVHGAQHAAPQANDVPAELQALLQQEADLLGKLPGLLALEQTLLNEEQTLLGNLHAEAQVHVPALITHGHHA